MNDKINLLNDNKIKEWLSKWAKITNSTTTSFSDYVNFFTGVITYCNENKLSIPTLETRQKIIQSFMNITTALKDIVNNNLQLFDYLKTIFNDLSNVEINDSANFKLSNKNFKEMVDINTKWLQEIENRLTIFKDNSQNGFTTNIKNAPEDKNVTFLFDLFNLFDNLTESTHLIQVWIDQMSDYQMDEQTRQIIDEKSYSLINLKIKLLEQFTLMQNESQNQLTNKEKKKN